MSKIIGVIPARYKSSRFPGKPLVEILGKPMIWWVYQNAIQVKELTEVYVATDDRRIESKCKELGLKVVMTSNKHPTGTDRIAEVADKIPADIYVNIQGDEPLVKPSTIKKAIIPGEQVTNLMTEIIRNEELPDPTVPKVVVNNENEAVFLSRLPIPYPKKEREKYFKQVCVYSFTAKALKRFSKLKRGPSERAEDIEILRFIENKIPVKMIEVKQDTIAVDIPEDVKDVEKALKKEKYQAIIFDFDGVLAKSAEIKSEAFKDLYKPYGLEDKVDITQGGISRFEKIKYFHKKLLNKNLTEKELNELAKKYTELTLNKVIKAPWIKGAKDFLESNYKDIDLYVVSGTPTDELKQIVNKRKMTKYFKELYGPNKAKGDIIQKIVKNKKYSPENVLYIGDRIADYEGAEKANVKFVGVNFKNKKSVFPKDIKVISEISDELWRL